MPKEQNTCTIDQEIINMSIYMYVQDWEESKSTLHELVIANVYACVALQNEQIYRTRVAVTMPFSTLILITCMSHDYRILIL